MKHCKTVAQNILGQLKNIDPNEFVDGQMSEDVHIFSSPIKGSELTCLFCKGRIGTKLQVKGKTFFICLEKPCLDYAESKKKSNSFRFSKS